MTKQLLIQAFFKTGSGAILLGLLLFLPAGTVHYWNACLLLAILFLPMLVAISHGLWKFRKTKK